MSPRVRAGKLRNRVVIQTNTPSDNGFGEPVVSWATLATVWAEVETMNGSEALASGAERTEAPVVFLFRYRSDVTTDNRLSWDGGLYDIESLENVAGRKKLLRATAVARG